MFLIIYVFLLSGKFSTYCQCWFTLYIWNVGNYFFLTSCPPHFCEHKNFCILCKDSQNGLPWDNWYSRIIIVADFWRIFEILSLYWRKTCFRKLLWSSFNLKKCCQKKSKLSTLLDKCPYLELSSSAFSHIRTEYGEIRSISSYSVRMPENTDKHNSEYGHPLHGGKLTCFG